MAPNLLVLGGTIEATALCKRLAEDGIQATVSFAGRVERPARHPIPRRIGGFGGPEGLAIYLRDHHVTHVVDATHPFAAQMSRNAVTACARAKVPMVALTRPAWTAQNGDAWTRVPDISGAVAALKREAERVMLAVGRMHLDEFTPNPQHFYLLRLVDPPETPPSFPHHHVLVSRGPFTMASDRAILEEFEIDTVVSKNAGGSGAYAKIEAARDLRLPVVMIDRPVLPARAEVHDPQAVIDWLHETTERGV